MPRNKPEEVPVMNSSQRRRRKKSKYDEEWMKIPLKNLKYDIEMQKKLRQDVLINNLDDIEHYVDQGVMPTFSYAPICFSPKDASDYWKILTIPVICKNKA